MESSPTDVSEIYILDSDTNNIAALYSPDPADRDRLDFDGTPQAKDWQPPRMRWDTVDGRPIPDIKDATGTPIFSQRAIDAFADLIEGRGELLPLEVEGGPADYFVCNVTHITDAFDQEQSELEYGEMSGAIMGIERYVFDSERVAQEAIFRLPVRRRDVYVTDAFRRRVEEAGLTGFLWDRLVWTADPADLERFEEERRRRIEAERAGDEERFYTHIVPTDEEVGPPGELIPHRIVPPLATDNEDLDHAQAKAHRLGIGPDDAENGVWLPRGRSVTAYTPSYLRELRQRLWPAEDRDQGVRVLREIAAELERGEFPHKG